MFMSTDLSLFLSSPNTTISPENGIEFDSIVGYEIKTGILFEKL